MLGAILTHIYGKLTRSYISLLRKCAFESTVISRIPIHVSTECVESTLHSSTESHSRLHSGSILRVPQTPKKTILRNYVLFLTESHLVLID